MKPGGVLHTLRDALGPLMVLGGGMGVLVGVLMLASVLNVRGSSEITLECAELGHERVDSGSLRLVGCRVDPDELLVVERDRGLVDSFIRGEVEYVVVPLRAADNLVAWYAVAPSTDLDELAQRTELYGDAGLPTGLASGHDLLEGRTYIRGRPTSALGARRAGLWLASIWLSFSVALAAVGIALHRRRPRAPVVFTEPAAPVPDAPRPEPRRCVVCGTYLQALVAVFDSSDGTAHGCCDEACAALALSRCPGTLLQLPADEHLQRALEAVSSAAARVRQAITQVPRWLAWARIGVSVASIFMTGGGLMRRAMDGDGTSRLLWLHDASIAIESSLFVAALHVAAAAAAGRPVDDLACQLVRRCSTPIVGTMESDADAMLDTRAALGRALGELESIAARLEGTMGVQRATSVMG